ncbi:MAG TPA: hypothetical protein VL484_01615 [Vicinamibacterales bacterium]|jgi:hypothetical protein|nr:hypothetical protein [Vicinamibacterales bacterium]
MCRCPVLACTFVLLLVTPGYASTAVFKDVKAAYVKSTSDRELVEQNADLILDDEARTVVVKGSDHGLNAKYDDVQKVVFDTVTRMRGGKTGRMIGGLTGAAISAHHVTESLCYLEYRDSDGSTKPYMLVLSTDSAPAVKEKMQAVFGDRVFVTNYSSKAAEIEKKTLKDIESKHDLKVDKKNHPLPEIVPDKALVVVACPSVPSEGSDQMKIHANDHVVLVNRSGTYGFFYLEPGEYQVASQAGNAVALQMKVDAGRDYYLVQEPFMGGMKSGTGLSQHSREMVMFLVDALNHAEWKVK